MTTPSNPEKSYDISHNNFGSGAGSGAANHNEKITGSGIVSSSGGNIINSPITITSIQGSKNILEQRAEEVAAEEQANKQVISYHIHKRFKHGIIWGLLSLLLLFLLLVIVYYWLFQQGKVSLSDVINTATSTALAPLVSGIIALLGTIITGSLSVDRFKNETSAETAAKGRLKLVKTRWEEIEGLGLLTPKEIRKIRKGK